MNAASLLITRIVLAISAPRPRDERGDVPGWVLVTVMTAGLVGALWKLAGPQLNSMLTAALDSVHN
ncbi:hypothetical protein [Nocardioides cynanchi]|uniref:hypothetical protein n=1 Tax=Nocardioides cynanchi TaxID=2558918 RepID=UPI00124788B9|nr:hypothetical protein [Nocardioides cynanchi]